MKEFSDPDPGSGIKHSESATLPADKERINHESQGTGTAQASSLHSWIQVFMTNFLSCLIFTWYWEECNVTVYGTLSQISQNYSDFIPGVEAIRGRWLCFHLRCAGYGVRHRVCTQEILRYVMPRYSSHVWKAGLWICIRIHWPWGVKFILLKFCCGSASALRSDSMTLWIRIQGQANEEEIYLLIYFCNFHN
jgi:hypothetical protein